MTETTVRPDSGTSHGVDSRRGWVVVFSAFLAMFTVFGVAYSFGEFFGPMADEFGTSRSETALFFAITTFAYFAIGPFTGRFADRIGPRPVIILGAVSMVIGLLLTAEVSSIQLGYLTYGLGVGIGVACCFVPMVATVGGWFVEKRTLALGLAVAGIGAGTLVLVPIMERVIDAQGWRDAYRVLAIISGVLLLIAAVGAYRTPGSVAVPRPIREVIRGRSDFWILYASSFFMSASLFTVFVFMADYIDATGSTGSAALLLGIIGMASIVGRLALGAFAAKVGIIALFRWSCLALGLSFLIWLAAGTNYPLLIAFAVVLGVAYGGIIALSPAVLAQLFGTVGMGGVLGALYTANGLGGLIGPPVMGRIIDSSGHSAAQWTAVASGLIGTALLYRLKPQSPG